MDDVADQHEERLLAQQHVAEPHDLQAALGHDSVEMMVRLLASERRHQA
jgi:hypothetical protein